MCGEETGDTRRTAIPERAEMRGAAADQLAVARTFVMSEAANSCSTPKAARTVT